MFFDKEYITEYNHRETVELNYLMDRIKQAVEDKLSYQPDYQYTTVVPKEDAEELLLNLYSALKDK
ncbi:hypothetical protein WKH56_20180 [Priestia sp. SB1]|uniref:hypothetical protein n=1 Tax=Priestia sp. SB1 TaxID=3132359 RepID=UPI0031762E32